MPDTNAVACANALFHSLAPTYYLDPNYCFIDWNCAFDEIIAIPLHLQKGQHVSEMVKHFEDKDAIFQRATNVFGVLGNVPLVDVEDLSLRTKKFGVLHFKKLATQVLNEKHEQVAWVVQLNICEAVKSPALWEAIAKRIEKEIR